MDSSHPCIINNEYSIFDLYKKFTDNETNTTASLTLAQFNVRDVPIYIYNSIY